MWSKDFWLSNVQNALQKIFLFFFQYPKFFLQKEDFREFFDWFWIQRVSGNASGSKIFRGLYRSVSDVGNHFFCSDRWGNFSVYWFYVESTIFHNNKISLGGSFSFHSVFQNFCSFVLNCGGWSYSQIAIYANLTKNYPCESRAHTILSSFL